MTSSPIDYTSYFDEGQPEDDPCVDTVAPDFASFLKMLYVPRDAEG
ncbi:MAG: hypothetical protein SFV81_19880 [Pirellulaceae bacterium]|nr:hypothetical protein [Pirellulaceae bacterium]